MSCNIRKLIALVVAFAPLIGASAVMIGLGMLVYKIIGPDGLPVLLWIFGVFFGLVMAYMIVHWAIETLLVAIGFSKEEINRERNPGTTFIFWR